MNSNACSPGRIRHLAAPLIGGALFLIHAGCTEDVTLGRAIIGADGSSDAPILMTPDGGFESWRGCTGLACGAACSPPPGLIVIQSELTCDTYGACRETSATACTTPGPIDPCANQLCGAACTLCEPGANLCFEDPAAKTCNKQGRCVVGTSRCL